MEKQKGKKKMEKRNLEAECYPLGWYVICPSCGSTNNEYSYDPPSEFKCPDCGYKTNRVIPKD